ncbi:hypothetical protein ALQ72_200056 [Pseudomonas syringae pv. maculicola]|nr:hypothetical protein ALQ72_200056 [Pseudomonas syringae pv. maculicola]
MRYGLPSALSLRRAVLSKSVRSFLALLHLCRSTSN